MACKCVNIEPQSKEAFNQMIVVDIPNHMQDYRKKRIEAGFEPLISIDPCIFDEIQMLWNVGIITYGCCCGHNTFESMVNVDDSNIDQMIDLGYVQNHPDKNRLDTFRLKSV
jgi:hypothetical protein